MKESSKIQGFTDFSKKFQKNEDCLEYFKKIRWKRGFVCPYCGKKPCWTIAPYKYKCRNCGRQTTVTAGTFFHRTHLTMQQWFKAIYYCCEKSIDATAKELKSIAGIGSYKTAQSTLDSIILRMYPNDKDKLGWTNNPLDGDIIIEPYWISINNTPIDIIIAAEYNDKKIGRIRILENEKSLTIKGLKSKYITPSSDIIDGSSYTDKIHDDFIEWCKGKKTKDFTVLSRNFCQMYGCCNTPDLFDTVLENMVKP